MSPPIHLMQGRLLPPVADRIQAFPGVRWREEVRLAPASGIDGIEWIFEVHEEELNPVGSDDGIADLASALESSGVVVESLCADWFMDRPLLRTDNTQREQRVAKLAWLIGRAGAAGIRRIVLPFVDASAITSEAEADEVTDIVGSVLSALEASQVELHMETSLAPEPFARLLAKLDHPLVMANYDTGNSASLGYDFREELAAYGPHIGSVHVKDRELNGGTVPLGRGAADIRGVLRALRENGWDRPLVLQAARGLDGEEPATVAAQAGQVSRWWDEA